MSEVKTATVETLTAEVRVLMVGSRQVTLSVFNQLDWCAPEAVEPFGRVRPRGAEWREIHVVGRNFLGHLVRSRCNRPEPSPSEEEKQWRMAAIATPPHERDEYQARFVRQMNWLNLPLIVLAGLR